MVRAEATTSIDAIDAAHNERFGIGRNTRTWPARTKFDSRPDSRWLPARISRFLCACLVMSCAFRQGVADGHN